MKRIALVLYLFAASTAAADQNYLDNSKTVTHDCQKERDITITGNQNKITFIGTCSKITVAGNQNKVIISQVRELAIAGNQNSVTVNDADSIGVPGTDNTLSWKKGLSDKMPKIANTGTGNKITQAK